MDDRKAVKDLLLATFLVILSSRLSVELADGEDKVPDRGSNLGFPSRGPATQPAMD